MQMDERKNRILRAIVQDYITTAEPVGSRTIAKKFDLGISSATIRNEMADMEEMGLLEQPHTSSGRIPMDAGYRYYVNCLMDRPKLSSEDKNVIELETTKRIAEIQEVISNTSKLLSQLTSLTSIVISPQRGKSSFNQMHFLPYQPGQAIMVVVKENGVVENQIVEIGENVTAEELQRIANVFNDKMKGHSMIDVRRGLLHEIYSELTRQRSLIDHALDLLTTVFNEPADDKNKVYLGGTLNMLNQPEFRDVDKVRSLLHVFEEDEQVRKLLIPVADGLSVTIGGENSVKELQDCSVISATYQIDGKPVGSIGVIGPTRMDYAKAMAMVDFMTKTLTELLAKRRRL
ncbi:heat-inducible transcriptional repressor HrcA [Desulfitobacterium metallireducens]|uniref:Heat-inducible transcription repressor HrcA n=1 Tax=Desulfitobacterium metallireducens DSM 15288 TaxID=871968 RepID=W0EF95_9FIRM|nr:heat-inducible transcriptional repressor HrcA [Desulfitobacterium metallireducens]AHF07874.1 HrcA family transcriptional regulator [Desulfitobacterium metallireducens DSM 15288]